MPLEELLAMYGYNGNQAGARAKSGGSGGADEPMDEGEDVDEEEEEDDDEGEEEDDDEESESTSSSLTALPDASKKTGGEMKEAPEAEEKAKVKSESFKHRSDLHLLYQNSNEEGSLPETRLLRSSGATGANASDEEGDEEDDEDYAPGEEEWRKVCNHLHHSSIILVLIHWLLLRLSLIDWFCRRS